MCQFEIVTFGKAVSVVLTKDQMALLINVNLALIKNGQMALIIITNLVLTKISNGSKNHFQPCSLKMVKWF